MFLRKAFWDSFLHDEPPQTLLKLTSSLFFYQLHKLLLKAEKIQDSESDSEEVWITKLSSFRVFFFLLQHHPQDCLRQLPLSGKLVVEPKLHEKKIVSLSRTCKNNEGIKGLYESTLSPRCFSLAFPGKSALGTSLDLNGLQTLKELLLRGLLQ